MSFGMKNLLKIVFGGAFNSQPKKINIFITDKSSVSEAFRRDAERLKQDYKKAAYDMKKEFKKVIGQNNNVRHF